MPRLVRRAAAMLLALPLAATLGAGTAAAEDITVGGCYGVALVVCDPTVSYGSPAGVEVYSTTVPVCFGSCQDVGVILVRPTGGGPLYLCISYKDRAGSASQRCAGDTGLPPLGDLVDLDDIDLHLVREVLDNAPYLVERLGERVRELVPPMCEDLC